jgi:hypothetical protein
MKVDIYFRKYESTFEGTVRVHVRRYLSSKRGISAYTYCTCTRGTYFTHTTSNRERGSLDRSIDPAAPPASAHPRRGARADIAHAPRASVEFSRAVAIFFARGRERADTRTPRSDAARSAGGRVAFASTNPNPIRSLCRVDAMFRRRDAARSRARSR